MKAPRRDPVEDRRFYEVSWLPERGPGGPETDEKPVIDRRCNFSINSRAAAANPSANRSAPYRAGRRGPMRFPLASLRQKLCQRHDAPSVGARPFHVIVHAPPPRVGCLTLNCSLAHGIATLIFLTYGAYASRRWAPLSFPSPLPPLPMNVHDECVRGRRVRTKIPVGAFSL